MLINLTTLNLRLNHIDDQDHAWPYRVDSVIQYITTSKPLILCAQEVLEGMLKDLRLLPDYSYLGIPRVNGEEYCPIFYNKEILEVREQGTFWLSKTPHIPNSIDFNSGCYRICTWAEFIMRDNRHNRFRVYNTHLDHMSSEARLEGIKIILEQINKNQKELNLPTILAGDFNSTHDDEPIQLLSNPKNKFGNQSIINTYNYLNEPLGPTFHQFGKITNGKPIDFIFVSDDIIVRSTKIFKENVLNKQLSDHYPVEVILDIKE